MDELRQLELVDEHGTEDSQGQTGTHAEGAPSEHSKRASTTSPPEETAQTEAPRQVKPVKPTPKAFGSCFFVSTDGIAITNEHVVDGARAIFVIDGRGTVYPASVLRAGDKVDLAALDVPAAVKHAAISVDGDGTRSLGEPVFTIGYPVPTRLGFDQKFADGSISGLAGFGDDTLLQITVPLQPGNSGGPIVGDNGMVIGVVVGKYDDAAALRDSGQLAQNVNFALKAGQLAPLLRGMKLPSLKPASKRAEAIARAQAASCQVVTF